VPAQQLRITVAGREHAMDAGTTAGEALNNISNVTGGAAASPGHSVIAARVNGELRDLAAPLADGDTVAPVELGSADGRTIMRHSTAHVMAQDDVSKGAVSFRYRSGAQRNGIPVEEAVAEIVGAVAQRIQV